MKGRPAISWRCRNRTFRIGARPLIMGILNVTPDSFSDGGRYLNHERAVSRGLAMVTEGAEIIDVGGESTRPGAEGAGLEEEAERVIPVIESLRAKTDAAVSVDTMKAEVARRALEAGADMINDVSALTHDPDMVKTARETGAGVVLMHMRGRPRTMQNRPRYGDVVREVAAYLGDRLDALTASGLERSRLAVDPGIGFGKTLRHNLALVAGLGALRPLGRPIVIGLSRKSFLGQLTGRPVNDRLAASLAGVLYCALHGADVMRVHDVKESLDVIRVGLALNRVRKTESPRRATGI